MDNIKFVYFGGEPLGVPVLEELKVCGLLPSLIVCNPDRPSGRGQKLTPPPVKLWAEENDIPVFQPESLKDKEQLLQLTEVVWDLFVVVAYNKIMPEWLIALPTHKTINVHPSLLPKLRGASPIRTAIIEDQRENVGVSIMLMDKEMDHGPLLAQEKMEIADEYWPINGSELDDGLAHMGGAMLANIIPKWVQSTIEPIPQNHSEATYCGRLTKDMAELQINPTALPSGDTAVKMLNVIQGFQGIGNAWFMHNDIRYKITEAHIENNTLIIDTVIPAGKSATAFKTYFN